MILSMDTEGTILYLVSRGMTSSMADRVMILYTVVTAITVFMVVQETTLSIRARGIIRSTVKPETIRSMVMQGRIPLTVERV